MGSGENRKFYDKTTTPECSEDRTAVLIERAVSQARLSLPTSNQFWVGPQASQPFKFWSKKIASKTLACLEFAC